MKGKTSTALAGKLLIGIALIAATAPALAQTRGRAPAAAAIGFGQTVNGQINSGDQCVNDPRVRFYRFTAQANTRIEITMKADGRPLPRPSAARGR